MSDDHTKGPWIAAPYSSVVGAPVVAANGRSVAKVTYYALASEGFANHERESDANGRLIAAAPDMLAALKHAAANMPYPDQMIDDAIAKAEGTLAKEPQ